MRVIVTGGRDYKDRVRVWSELEHLREEYGRVVVITGKCPTGADQFAAEWAQIRGFLVEVPADWDTRGKRAGPERNQTMLQYYFPDRVLAFPGGRGTADMVKRAKRRGVPVFEIA